MLTYNSRLMQSGGVDLGPPLILDNGYDSPETAILRCEPDEDVLLAGGEFALLSMSRDGKSRDEDLPG